MVRAHSEATCALDVAEDQSERDQKGRLPLAVIGSMLGITGERVRQIEARALARLKAMGVDLEGSLGQAGEDDDSQPVQGKRVRLRVIGGQGNLPL